MPSPKDGSPGKIVPPAEPVEAKDADDADPGQVEQVKQGQRQTGAGKYGSQQVKPFKPGAGAAGGAASPPSNPTTSWIEIVLVDEEQTPVAGEEYRITVPDGSVKEGTLDEKGFARVEGFDPGTCKVTFPRLDQDAWEPA